MGRRRGTLAQLMTISVERQMEWANGRIFTFGGNWVFEPTEDQKLKTLESYSKLIVSKDETGREIFLISQECIRCPNDIGDYPLVEGCKYVPAIVCRKCEHYRKARTDGLAYPHCNWARQRRGGTQGGAKAFLEDHAAVLKETNEILKEIL